MKHIITLIILTIGIGLHAQIPINTNFDVSTPNPIDRRMTIATLADTSTIADLYDGLLTVVEDTDELWIYNGTQWVEFEGADGNGIYSGSGSLPNSIVEIENTAGLRFTDPNNGSDNIIEFIQDADNLPELAGIEFYNAIRFYENVVDDKESIIGYSEDVGGLGFVSRQMSFKFIGGGTIDFEIDEGITYQSFNYDNFSPNSLMPKSYIDSKTNILFVSQFQGNDPVIYANPWEAVVDAEAGDKIIILDGEWTYGGANSDVTVSPSTKLVKDDITIEVIQGKINIDDYIPSNSRLFKNIQTVKNFKLIGNLTIEGLDSENFIGMPYVEQSDMLLEFDTLKNVSITDGSIFITQCSLKINNLIYDNDNTAAFPITKYFNNDVQINKVEFLGSTSGFDLNVAAKTSKVDSVIGGNLIISQGQNEARDQYQISIATVNYLSDKLSIKMGAFNIVNDTRLVVRSPSLIAGEIDVEIPNGNINTSIKLDLGYVETRSLKLAGYDTDNSAPDSIESIISVSIDELVGMSDSEPLIQIGKDLDINNPSGVQYTFLLNDVFVSPKSRHTTLIGTILESSSSPTRDIIINRCMVSTGKNGITSKVSIKGQPIITY